MECTWHLKKGSKSGDVELVTVSDRILVGYGIRIRPDLVR
jgi:hypothetical protein